MYIVLPPVKPVLYTIIAGVTVTSVNAKYSISLKENNMSWIKSLWNRITMEIRYRKKLKELRKRDPFIYK